MAVNDIWGLELLPRQYIHIIRWLANARCKENTIEAREEGSTTLPWGEHGIFIRQCYTKFEDEVMQSWFRIRRPCCVVTGTPGIGKSTLLFYLLWKFMHEGLKDYQTVLYGDEGCLFYIQRDGAAGSLRIHPFDPLGRNFEGRSLGLVDTPPECRLAGYSLDSQNILAKLCVDHLLIAASAGLLEKHSNLSKATQQTRVLPAWQPEALHRWCCERCGLLEQEWKQRVQLCGDEVPRLVLAGNVPQQQDVWQESFHTTQKSFLNAIVGITVQGLGAAPRDAHTLLILQPSTQLAEGPGEVLAGPEAGEMLRYVSAHVQQEVNLALLTADRLPGFLSAIPQAAPFAFEELVLQWLTKEGLEVQGRNLKTCKESWLEDLLTAKSQPQLNVLYRPRSRHYPSIDAFAVMDGDVRTAYFIQVTTAMKHVKVQLRHVETLPFADAESIVCLYIVPALPGFQLSDGDGPLLASNKPASKEWRQEIASAEAVLSRFQPHIRGIFLGDAGVVQTAAKRQKK